MAQKVLVAAGRVGNVEELGLEAAGLTATEKGLLEVNAQYQTSVAHVYAAGDLIGFPGPRLHRHGAGARGHDHMPAGRSITRSVADLLPVGIYTIPEVSSVGETEESLKERRVPYVVGRASLAENVRANLIGEAVGFLKLVARPEGGELLGVALHRPPRVRARSPGERGDGPRRHHSLLYPGGLQLPDARRGLQVRRLRRPHPAEAARPPRRTASGRPTQGLPDRETPRCLSSRVVRPRPTRSALTLITRINGHPAGVGPGGSPPR